MDPNLGRSVFGRFWQNSLRHLILLPLWTKPRKIIFFISFFFLKFSSTPLLQLNTVSEFSSPRCVNKSTSSSLCFLNKTLPLFCIAINVSLNFSIYHYRQSQSLQPHFSPHHCLHMAATSNHHLMQRLFGTANKVWLIHLPSNFWHEQSWTYMGNTKNWIPRL